MSCPEVCYQQWSLLEYQAVRIGAGTTYLSISWASVDQLSSASDNSGGVKVRDIEKWDVVTGSKRLGGTGIEGLGVVKDLLLWDLCQSLAQRGSHHG